MTNAESAAETATIAGKGESAEAAPDLNQVRPELQDSAPVKVSRKRRRSPSSRDRACVNSYGWNLYELRKLNAALPKFGYNLTRLERIIKTKTRDQIVQFIGVLRSENEEEEEENESHVQEETSNQMQETHSQPDETVLTDTEEPGPSSGSKETPVDMNSRLKWVNIMDFLRKQTQQTEHGDLSDVLGEVMQRLSNDVRKNTYPMSFKPSRRSEEIKFDFYSVYDYLACVSKDVEPPPPSPFASIVISMLLEGAKKNAESLHDPQLEAWLKLLEEGYQNKALSINVVGPSDGSGESKADRYLDYMSLNPLCIKTDLLRKSKQKQSPKKSSSPLRRSRSSTRAEKAGGTEEETSLNVVDP